ncbi:MAG: MOSC domain-containing protein [Planctomycetota bacterium]
MSTVVAVSRSSTHTFSKTTQPEIRLLAGLGVEGDAHMGETVKHRSRVKQDPTQPNLRQVHLVHAELHDALRADGFDLVQPGAMGENVLTRGVDLLALPTGTRLQLGATAVVELTGLRNPCGQLNGLHKGLKDRLRIETGDTVQRLAGVMAIVIEGGDVKPGDAIRVTLPAGPHRPMEPV